MSSLSNNSDLTSRVLGCLTDNHHDLSQCARVSQAFHDLAIPLLYWHLTVDPAHPSQSLNPANLLHTRILTLKYHPHSLCSTLQPLLFPNLETLHLRLIKVITGPAHLCLGQSDPSGYICPIIRDIRAVKVNVVLEVSSDCRVPVIGEGFSLPNEMAGGEVEVVVEGRMDYVKGREWVRDDSWDEVFASLRVKSTFQSGQR
jgi:hypothetical protein